VSHLKITLGIAFEERLIVFRHKYVSEWRCSPAFHGIVLTCGNSKVSSILYGFDRAFKTAYDIGCKFFSLAGIGDYHSGVENNLRETPG
jgi:hypothetical protein